MVLQEIDQAAEEYLRREGEDFGDAGKGLATTGSMFWGLAAVVAGHVEAGPNPFLPPASHPNSAVAAAYEAFVESIVSFSEREKFPAWEVRRFQTSEEWYGAVAKYYTSPPPRGLVNLKAIFDFVPQPAAAPEASSAE